MPFQLTIAEGKEAGREFVFEQPQVVIGRTSECDVVLYDPGVSRKHARIFVEGTAYFVEDMGSSNGTKVNGSVVKKQQLSDGDAVSLGPVVFVFSAAKGDGTDPAGAVPLIAHQDTRVFQMGADQKPRQLNKGAALAPQNANLDELSAIQRSQTRSMNAVRPRASNSSNGRSAEPEALSPTRTPGGSPVLTPGGSPVIASVRRSGSAPLEEGRLSAADRARIRRDNPNLYGSLKILWLDASSGVRAAILVFLGLAVLGGLAGAAVYISENDNGKKPPPPEPGILARKPIPESFGCGEGVTYQRCDQKGFDFEFVAATRSVVLLHFQSMEVSDGEVTVSVNAAEVGKVPADTLNAGEVAHEILIPPENLKKGQKNHVIFDNIRNPPATDPWRIWNLWVEVVPLPEASLDDLLRDARTEYDRGQQKMDRKDVGASNRYEAWADFRRAWLLLEAHPNPKPELYLLARTKMHDTQKELDSECQKLLLEAEQYYSQKNWNAARATFDHVRDFFPNNDQPCPLRSDQRRSELSL